MHACTQVTGAPYIVCLRLRRAFGERGTARECEGKAEDGGGEEGRFGHRRLLFERAAFAGLSYQTGARWISV